MRSVVWRGNYPNLVSSWQGDTKKDSSRVEINLRIPGELKFNTDELFFFLRKCCLGGKKDIFLWGEDYLLV